MVLFKIFLLFAISSVSAAASESMEKILRFRRQDQPLPPLKTFNCRTKFYDNVMHKGDLLHTWRNIKTINDCIGYCAQFSKDNQECRAINYFSLIGRCDLLSRASSDPSSEKVPANLAWANMKHVVIVGCQKPAQQPPEQPVPKMTECGKPFIQPRVEPVDARRRIVNGDDAVAHSWPWVVSITYYGKHVCGGSLVPLMPGLDESDVVLTAAHCVNNQAIGPLNASNLVVIAGSHSLAVKEGGEQTSTAESLHWHDYFSQDTLMNDIALIKLRTPIKFSTVVTPVCLPKLSEATDVNAVCMAAGWGRYQGKADRSLSDILQQLRVPVVEMSTCRKPTVWGGHISTSTMLCAGSMTGKRNVCGGDSGGALMCLSGAQWYQHGVISFVNRQDCAAANKPGVYTRVSMYRSWIDDIIGKRSVALRKAKKRRQ